MNAPHQSLLPGRVGVPEAAARTGHTPAGGAHGDAVLLDVRELHEWQAGHAPRAVHLPLSALAAGAPLPDAARGTPLIVICRSGNRSRQAVALLAERGADAVDVTGGMRDWADAGLPVVDAHGRDGSVS
ncbi:rhodanese-like domain-containing protein [Streptomyces sp. GESEQ-13]|uniref:rhodanese-like domain-containing protein n=1 Tax=Streptomyces sp. GESEQ-13 TaxID=2812654 RepID=UPI001B32B209